MYILTEVPSKLLAFMACLPGGTQVFSIEASNKVSRIFSRTTGSD